MVGARAGGPVLIVLRVSEMGDSDLLQVADAFDGLRLVTSLVQRGQQHRRQYGDDRYHHEQLN